MNDKVVGQFRYIRSIVGAALLQRRDVKHGLVISCVVLIGIWCSSLFGAGNPAGTVLYTTKDDQVYLLLADHTGLSQRGWGAYGGGAEAGESPAQTAARETEEETLGFFSREQIQAVINDKQPVFDGYFYLYFAEIDFVPAAQVQNHVPVIAAVTLRERGPYAWIPYSEVKKFLVSTPNAGKYIIADGFLPKGSKRNWFWSVWIENMREAYQQGMIPWDTRKDIAPVK